MASTALTPSPESRPGGKPSLRSDAEAMAKKQREISVSEFFAKNRHLLGFDNPRKALMTTIKEAVDNALDACEEAGILPDLFIGIEPLNKETRFRVTVRDNGPGIVRRQIENVFGRLLYGSKFHRLKMSRGQQGIGIAAAGMYALMTTGKPMVIHSKPHKSKPSHRLVLAIDTQKNRADVSDEEERYDFPHDTGTEVVLELEARYQRGRQSVDEYLQQTAIANPHAQIIYQPPDCCLLPPLPLGEGRGEAGQEDGSSLLSKQPERNPGAPSPQPSPKGRGGPMQDPQKLRDDYAHAVKLAASSAQTTTAPGGTVVFPRAVKQLPQEIKEIKPHPNGIELGTLLKMLKGSEGVSLSQFLTTEFCRISPRVASDLTEKAGMTPRTRVTGITHEQGERLYAAMQETRFIAPPTDCLAPIGDGVIRAGLLKGVKAEFYTSITRPPAVYRGNPFQVEVGIAYGGDLPPEEPARVIRFANRVPLLYQQSACCAFKAVADTMWRNYSLSQPKGSLPVGPLVVMIHMASVWVPFTSESKEAIADYDEIRKEMKLALSECGRKLKTYLNRRARVRRESERRGVFERYMGETVKALARIDGKIKPEKLLAQFQAVAKLHTVKADTRFDEDGNLIRQVDEGFDDSVVIIESNMAPLAPGDAEAEAAPGQRARESNGENGEGLFD